MAGSEILSAARNIMKFVTEGRGFDRVMRNVSDPASSLYIYIYIYI